MTMAHRLMTVGGAAIVDCKSTATGGGVANPTVACHSALIGGSVATRDLAL
jgi:hypothetical protein